MILKSFIKEIVKKGNQATIRYTLPLAPSTVITEPGGVLSSVQCGGPWWSRTPKPQIEIRASLLNTLQVRSV